jgi:hypothetical protein
MFSYIFAILITGISTLAFAGNMYLPMAGKIPTQEMKKLGFEVTEKQILDMSEGAVLHYNDGCTATFQSPDGLFGTNHHCAKGSCVERFDVAEKLKVKAEGFIAPTQDKELKCNDNFVRILNNVSNVSKDFAELENSKMEPSKKFAAIEKKMKDMVEKCENKQKTKFCKVAVMDNEKEPYYLYNFDVLDDVRLVWYPSDNLGNFGGDTDNWEYPRYTTDFSYLRAYKDGKPYQSKNFIKTSAEGVKPGDPQFIVGFPGNTDRNVTSVETQYIHDLVMPFNLTFFNELIPMIEKNEAYNQPMYGFLNYKKNFELKLDLMDRFKVIENKKAIEAKNPALQPSITEASKIVDKKYALFPTLATLRLYDRRKLAKSYAIATEYVDAKKNEKKHAKIYTAKEKQEEFEKVSARVNQWAKQFDPEMDVKMLTYFFEKMDRVSVPVKPFIELKAEVQNYIQNELKKPAGTSDPLVVQKNPDIHRQMAQYLVSKSTLVKDVAGIKNYNQFDKDRLVVFASAMKKSIDDLDEQMTNLDNQLAWHNRDFNIKMGAVTPDANSTMRFTFGTVQKKYQPLYKKGTFNDSTYIAGMLGRNAFIKDKNNPDYKFFQLPKEFVQAGKTSRSGSKFADRRTGDVPICFISDHTITGGNSGSGVFNKRGELVGYAFDGTPESVLGDIYEIPDGRTILFDIRTVGYLGTEVYPQAKPILKELGLIK